MCDRVAPFLALRNDLEGRIFSCIFQMFILYFDLVSSEPVIMLGMKPALFLSAV